MFAALVFVMTQTALADPTLNIEGTCPGTLDIDIRDLSAGTTLVLDVATEEGSTVLPDGRCAGTVTSLESPRAAKTFVDSDRDTRLYLTPTLSTDDWCGRYVQILDLDACTMSNVDTLGGGPMLGVFAGFASWSQNTSTQTDEDQDSAMTSACESSYPGSYPSSTEQLASGELEGLPETNTSGMWLMGTCPFCEGNADIGSLEGYCRMCVTPDDPMPTELPPDGWHDNCCVNTRSTACIY